jgi:hypothetical protein
MLCLTMNPATRLFLWLVLLACFSVTSWASQLRLCVVDDQDRPVSGVKAELLLAVWGDIRRVPLTVDGSEVIIPTDPAAMEGWWPEQATNWVEVQVLVAAPGFAPMKSSACRWFAVRDDQQSVLKTTLTFPRHAPLAIGVGGNRGQCSVALPSTGGIGDSVL